MVQGPLFMLYESWAEAFLEDHAKPYRIEYDAKLEALLQRSRESQILWLLGEWLKP